MDLTDTICALATPSGMGGIAILRISGPRAWEAGRLLFRPASGNLPDPPPLRHMLYGSIVRHGEPVDEVLAVFFQGPASYTAEDAVEIQGHGGPAVMARILELALAAGCRQARPGEFTLRAFLNGRLDLSAAEAVAELVEAGSRSEARLALSALSGGLARRLAPVRAALTEAAAALEAAVDFPDEAPELAGPGLGRALAQVAVAPLERLLAERQRRAAFKDGGEVVICGRPNAGKSSLFNALLGMDRAIVATEAGTTRDAIAEKLVLGGVCCRLVDTAGLGPADGELDRLAQEAARRSLGAAHLALLVLDGSAPLQAEDRAALAETEARPRLVCLSKSDLPPAWNPAAEGLAGVPQVCAKSGQGVAELAEAIGAALTGGAPEPEPGEVAASARQAEALARCLAAARAAAEGLAGEDPQPEIVSLELAEALAALGEVDGQGAPDSVIEAVFENFCVGK